MRRRFATGGGSGAVNARGNSSGKVCGAYVAIVECSPVFAWLCSIEEVIAAGALRMAVYFKAYMLLAPSPPHIILASPEHGVLQVLVVPYLP